MLYQHTEQQATTSFSVISLPWEHTDSGEETEEEIHKLSLCDEESGKINSASPLSSITHLRFRGLYVQNLRTLSLHLPFEKWKMTNSSQQEE